MIQTKSNMKFCLVTLVLALLAVATATKSGEISAADRWARVSRLWKQYKAEYNWAYPSLEEETYRFELFSKRLHQVEEHKARNLSWKQGINHLSVLTRSELAGLGGLRMDSDDDFKSQSPQELGILNDSDVGDIPAYFSWLDVPNVVGPAKDQGQCGSCWAFTTVALIESRERLLSNNLTSLSEQQLVDCVEAHEKGATGCDGQYMHVAANYVLKYGLETERDYPYYSSRGRTQKCRFNPSKVYPTTREIKRFSYLKCVDEDELKRVVYRYGPVSIVIKGDFKDLVSYSDGVFDDDASNNGDYYHAISLVGYGTDEQGLAYWILKNSWSQNWGIEGFFKLVRNRNFFSLLKWPSVVL